MSQQPVFKEIQRFRQIWIVVIVLGIAALMWWSVFQQIVLDRPFGDEPAPDIFLIIFWLVFGIGFPVGGYYLKLVFEVYPDHLQVRFMPLLTRRIPISSITSAEAVTYKPIRQYGGWGIRWGFSGGKAYNVSGNRGVQLVLDSGERLLLGSQKPDELALALQTQMRRANSDVQ